MPDNAFQSDVMSGLFVCPTGHNSVCRLIKLGITLNDDGVQYPRTTLAAWLEQ